MTTQLLLIILIVIVLVNLIVLLTRKQGGASAQKDMLHQIRDEFQRNRAESQSTAKNNREELGKNLNSFANANRENNKELNHLIRQKFGDFEEQQGKLNENATTQMKDIKTDIEKQLTHIREDNEKKLKEIRETVDEKLQTTLEKRLSESFKQVSERLEKVHQGLGEMQKVATGVGDLKRVLSNVKTRGVLGEYQLENILEQILTKEQYGKNVATVKGSQKNVEFAVKLPGKEEADEVWMPIDSKFPMETYERLLNAKEKGEIEDIISLEKALARAIESFAKDISEKYINPPNTTNFALMFLPVEGLYAEILRNPGLFEKIQRKYRITITGPTTLSAVLNSLQMGFRTLAIQKRSGEVWKILEAVKAEFGKFTAQLEVVDRHLGTASNSLNKLRHTRTNVMNRTLKDIGKVQPDEIDEVIGLPKEREE